jgi:hypothetical protein
MSEPAFREGELLKGLFLPLLLLLAALPPVLAYVLIWNHKNGQPPGDGIAGSIPVAALIAFIASTIACAVFFRKGNRRRAYGVIAGCLGTPILLAMLFWAWVTLFKVNLLPH